MRNKVIAEAKVNAVWYRDRIIIPGNKEQTYSEIVSMVRDWIYEGKKPEIVLFRDMWDHVADSFATYYTSSFYEREVDAKSWIGRLLERLGLREKKKGWVTVSASQEMIDRTRAEILDKLMLPIDGRWYLVRFREE